MQRNLCSQVAAHPMHSGPRRRRARAEKNARIRSGVRIELRKGTSYELQQRVGAATDIATNEVRVVRLELGGVERMPGDNAIAKAGREAFHLPLNAFSHVFRRTVRNMAVAPRCVLAGRGAGRIEQRLLREQDKGPLGDSAAPDFRLMTRNLLDRAAEVHGG